MANISSKLTPTIDTAQSHLRELTLEQLEEEYAKIDSRIKQYEVLEKQWQEDFCVEKKGISQFGATLNTKMRFTTNGNDRITGMKKYLQLIELEMIRKKHPDQESSVAEIQKQSNEILKLRQDVELMKAQLKEEKEAKETCLEGARNLYEQIKQLDSNVEPTFNPYMMSTDTVKRLPPGKGSVFGDERANE